MITLQVTVSGTVGKQVFPTPANQSTTTRPSKVVLRGLNLLPLSAAAYVQIRDGNASGDVIIEHNCVTNAGKPIIFPSKILFNNGMHVKVLGTSAKCYLWID